ncbi:hypothetical protein GCM10010289_07860 [Streptomyces violascens]|uniref:Uncharacterized protein n=1 Tax=Streptomyces violascens TaxID=67381 RepID=A0ABQ3QGM9_9ACTN|nr:hypothetical protein GCM10010289_07860 [Streptomyces violascens]GHI36451.1 hypothetical protein Sviol_08590 [Streptomyces violascens]
MRRSGLFITLPETYRMGLNRTCSDQQNSYGTSMSKSVECVDAIVIHLSVQVTGVWRPNRGGVAVTEGS